MKQRTVMLAAGGTGGHLFPAQALAEELARRGHVVELATDMRGDRYGTGFPAREIHRLPAATLAARNPIAMAKTGLTLSRGLIESYRLLARVRPSAVVGFGGYPSFAPLMAARLRRIPTALHEQNAVLGRANRMLSRRVTAVATSFESVKLLEGSLREKAHFTGNPVRAQVRRAALADYEPPAADRPVSLVVFGGSQGARFFSDTVPPALAALPSGLQDRLRVIQQVREEDLERVRAAYAHSGIQAELAPFFRDLPERMASAHLVVGRAGASTIAELTVLGRPSLLVPLPHAVDNDQLHNAARLAESDGAWCIEQKALTPDRLTAELDRLLSAPELLRNAARAARLQGRPDAVERLADLVEGLMECPAAG